jgi:thermostable 8-oxoguanine DNA glycosylase
MKFRFCDEISEIIQSKLIVEFKELCDEKLIEAVLEELHPFIVTADISLKSSFGIHQDIHYNSNSEFYKNRNTVIEQMNNRGASPKLDP